LDKLTGGFRPYLVLSLLCLILYLPGLASVPPLDRDESRFIQATRQMLASGDYVRIQFQGEMRAKKPVGAYWLQAAAVKAFSDPESTALWPYRLPAALSAWAVALMTFAFGHGLLGRRPALLAGIMVATAVMLVSEAHQAKTDAVLLAAVVAAQGALGQFYLAGRTGKKRPGLGLALAFWVAQGIGILVKGPIVPVVSLLTLVTLGVADRSLRWALALRPLTGMAVAAAIAAPWFVAISQATGGAFVGEAVKSDLLPKLLGAQESHGGWPGYYALLAIATFWPASLLAWPAMAGAWAERHRPALRFLLAWALPCWAMFELVPTKLPHYVLPAFPAIALITAALVAEGAPVFKAVGARVYYVAWNVVGLVLAAAVVAMPMEFGRGFDAASVPAAVGILLATVLPSALAFKGRLIPAALALALTAGAAYPAVFAHVLPELDRLWVSRSLAAMVGSLGVAEPVAAAGYSEPSLVVLLGTNTRFTDGIGAAGHLAAHPDSLALVVDAERPAFLAAAAAAGLAVVDYGRVDGFNYSRGKPIAITVSGLRR